MRNGVEVVADLRGDRVEPLLALRNPAITPVQQVVTEKSSTSPASHSHGKEPANSRNRRSNAIRASIVVSANKRDRCCRSQPDNIASRTAPVSSR